MLTMRSALERAERLFGENTAIIDAEARFTWAEHLDRVKRLAGVLQENGIGKGDRFGIICRNTWRHCELIHADGPECDSDLRRVHAHWLKTGAKRLYKALEGAADALHLDRHHLHTKRRWWWRPRTSTTMRRVQTRLLLRRAQAGVASGRYAHGSKPCACNTCPLTDAM